MIRKIRLIPKFMASQPRKQTIAIHIFPNISRSIGNQTMKVRQLIDYNMGNTVLKKLYTEFGGEAFALSYSIKSKDISGSIV